MNYIGEVVWWDIELEVPLARRLLEEDGVQFGDTIGMQEEPRRGCSVRAVKTTPGRYEELIVQCGDGPGETSASGSVVWDAAPLTVGGSSASGLVRHSEVGDAPEIEGDGGTWY